MIIIRTDSIEYTTPSRQMGGKEPIPLKDMSSEELIELRGWIKTHPNEVRLLVGRNASEFISYINTAIERLLAEKGSVSNPSGNTSRREKDEFDLDIDETDDWW